MQFNVNYEIGEIVDGAYTGKVFNVEIERNITNFNIIKASYIRPGKIKDHWRKQANNLKFDFMQVDFCIDITPWKGNIPDLNTMRVFIEKVHEYIDIKNNTIKRQVTQTEKAFANQELDKLMCHYGECETWYDSADALYEDRKKLFKDVDAVKKIIVKAY